MGDEKIFKDLTKKYAELAKCIHSKDKRSVSLIKSCSKRIALLDKLRVLEVSYLKCLKNKVKRGQKGGKEGDELSNQDGLSNEDDADAIEAQNDNRQRALEVCTNTLEKGFNALDKGTYLTETAGNYIKEKARNIIESSKGIDASEVKTKIEDAIKDLVDNGMNADEANAYLNGASEILANKVKQIYNNNKETTLEDIVNNIYKKGINLRAKVSPVLGKGLELGRESYKKAKGLLPSFFRTNQQPAQQPAQQPTVGGKKTTYRLNGEKVLLLHKNKKVQRSIYVKDKGKTKYCKIDKEYVLLSKVKNKIQ